MNKMKYLMTAILLCSMGMFTSCSVSDNPTPVTPSVSDELIKSKLKGIWVYDQCEGQRLETQAKTALKFDDDWAYVSTYAGAPFDDDSYAWNEWDQYEIEIKDGKVILTNIDDGSLETYILQITAISDQEMDCISSHLKDGKASIDGGVAQHWVKSDIDCGSDICGLWEIKFTSDIPEEAADKTLGVYFLLSSNAVRYQKEDDGTWTVLEGYDYFRYADVGPLLFLRWAVGGGALTEVRAWEILSFKDGVIKLKADYYADDTHTQLKTKTAELIRRELPTVSTEDIKANILGKWLSVDLEGIARVTLSKYLNNFTSLTECYTSRNSQDVYFDEKGKMQASYKNDVQIDNGTITLTHTNSEGGLVTVIMRVLAISDTEMYVEQGDFQGEETEPSLYIQEHFVKTTVDYSKDICGMWEGTIPEDKSDSKPHRFEFMADGTYKFYTQDASGNWINQEGYFSEYFTAGPLLVQRWAYLGHGGEEEDVDDDGYIRKTDCWEISSIENGTMIWVDDDITVKLKKVQ